MKKFLPYFSAKRLSTNVYHNYLDCPAGSMIARGDRRPGVGPNGVLNEQCEHCKRWDDELTESRATLHRWLYESED